MKKIIHIIYRGYCIALSHCDRLPGEFRSSPPAYEATAFELSDLPKFIGLGKSVKEAEEEIKEKIDDWLDQV